MYVTVNLSTFRDHFMAIRPNNFSYQGLEVLFDYLEDMDDNSELDVIALCCEFTEDTPSRIALDYDIDIEGMEDEEITSSVIDYLMHECAFVGETDTTILYRNF